MAGMNGIRTKTISFGPVPSPRVEIALVRLGKGHVHYLVVGRGRNYTIVALPF